MKYKLPKTLVLNVRKWRCGGDSMPDVNSRGTGETNLHNNEHYECCLGQFSRQAGCTIDQIKNRTDPYKLDFNIIGLSENGLNTDLSNEAININDDYTTTIQEKIRLLKERCKEHGYKLVVKNLPKRYQNTK